MKYLLLAALITFAAGQTDDDDEYTDEKYMYIALTQDEWYTTTSGVDFTPAAGPLLDCWKQCNDREDCWGVQTEAAVLPNVGTLSKAWCSSLIITPPADDAPLTWTTGCQVWEKVNASTAIKSTLMPQEQIWYVQISSDYYYAYGQGANLQAQGGSGTQCEQRCNDFGHDCWGFQTTADFNHNCGDLGCCQALIMSDPGDTQMIETAGVAVYQKGYSICSAFNCFTPTLQPTVHYVYPAVTQAYCYAFGGGAELQSQGGDFETCKQACTDRGHDCWGIQTTYGTDYCGRGCCQALIVSDPGNTALIYTLGVNVWQKMSEADYFKSTFAPRLVTEYVQVQQDYYYLLGSGADLKSQGGNFETCTNACDEYGEDCWGVQTTGGDYCQMLIIGDPSGASLTWTVGVSVWQKLYEIDTRIPGEIECFNKTMLAGPPCYEQGIDYSGSDTWSIDNIQCANLCQMQCAGNPGCFFWSWWADTLVCYMKDSNGGRTETTDNVISGPAYCGRYLMTRSQCEHYGYQTITSQADCGDAARSLQKGDGHVDQNWDTTDKVRGCWLEKSSNSIGFNKDMDNWDDPYDEFDQFCYRYEPYETYEGVCEKGGMKTIKNLKECTDAVTTLGLNAPNQYEVADDSVSGEWGGYCTCPDGSVFGVGDQANWCESLSCYNGEAGECNEWYDEDWAHGVVTCSDVSVRTVDNSDRLPGCSVGANNSTVFYNENTKSHAHPPDTTSICVSVFIRDTVSLDADYHSTLGHDNSQFLKECSTEVDAECVGAEEGSIVVTLEGSPGDVQNSKDHIERNGLSLPTYGRLHTKGYNAAATSSPDTGDDSSKSEVSLKLPFVIVPMLVAFLFGICLTKLWAGTPGNKSNDLVLNQNILA